MISYSFGTQRTNVCSKIIDRAMKKNEVVFEAGSSEHYLIIEDENKNKITSYLKKKIVRCHWEAYINVDDPECLSPERPLDMSRIGCFAINPFNDMRVEKSTDMDIMREDFKLEQRQIKDNNDKIIATSYGNGFMEYDYPAPESRVGSIII